MSHFAEINPVDGEVIRVIVAEQKFINSGVVGDSFRWVQTSYNTSGGVHLNSGYPFRKNHAVIGGFYDKTRDAFIPPQPYNSWTLNEDTCLYEPPVAMPDDGKSYTWDEPTTNWKEAD
jgi:hypothetical protein